MKIVVLMIFGLSGGLLVSAGVFTVLLAVGLTPRYAGKTGTADHIHFYESCIVWGALIGCICSLYPGLWTLVHRSRSVWQFSGIVQKILLGIMGLFMGMFTGTLALAIAEMFNSIPIFARRIQFKKGLGIVVSAMAIGKMLGSLYYFWNGGLLFNG